jgi:hypothetical protein
MQQEQFQKKFWTRAFANFIASTLIVVIAAYADLRGIIQLLTVPDSLFIMLPIAVVGTVGNKVLRRPNLPFIATLLGACFAAEIVQYFDWGYR